MPKLVERTRQLAEEQARPLIDAARAMAAQRLSGEVHRLRQLQRVNRLVRDEEIARLVEQQAALDTHISNARLRLDAVRVIRRGR
jgi:ATP-dependent helicase HepA